MRRRGVLAGIGALVAAAAGCAGSAGTDRPEAFQVASAAFAGERLPRRYTCDGTGESPSVTVERVPDPAEALALVVAFDVQTITRTTVWTLWNVPPGTERVPAGLARTPTVDSLDGASQGQTARGDVGYQPPCPPVEQPYTVRLRAYALDRRLDLPAETTHDDAREAIRTVTLASRVLGAEYVRPASRRETA